MSSTRFSTPDHRQPEPTAERRDRTWSVSDQMFFRDMNEQISLLRDSDERGDLSIVCECEQHRCRETFAVSSGAYEAVRRFPTRFMLRPGHSREDDERIIEQHRGFIVVEKTGSAAHTAIRLDPRARPLTRSESAGRDDT